MKTLNNLDVIDADVLNVAYFSCGNCASSGSSAPEILNLLLTSTTVNNSYTTGMAIGDLTPVGGTNPVVFSITADIDNKFILDDTYTKLLTKNTFDYITQNTHGVSLRATDVNLKTYDKDYTINVLLENYSVSNCLKINDGVSNQYTNATITGTPLNMTSEFTIGFYINTINQSSFSHISFHTGSAYKFAIFNNGTGGDQQRFYIFDNGGNNKNFIVSSPTVDFSSSPSWVHCVITYKNNVPKVYYNATNQPNFSYFTNNTLGTLNSVDNLLIGSRNVPPTATTNMKISNLVVFDKELNATEVSELYNSGSPYNYLGHSQSASLRGWWKFEGLDSNMISDETGTADMNVFNLTGTDFVSFI